MGFTGQAPEDFESIGERIVTQQTLIAQGKILQLSVGKTLYLQNDKLVSMMVLC